MKNQTLITAHSGAEGMPDNSLEFVRYALTIGVDALEIDVRRRADGVLVLGHDTADAQAPTLQEVFLTVAAQPNYRINCDLKEKGLEYAVYKLALACGMQGRLLYSGTVDVNVFQQYPEMYNVVEVYLNLEEYIPDLYIRYRDIPDFELEAAKSICTICKEHGIQTVNMHQGLVTRRFLHILAENGLRVSAWTVNDSQQLQWFLKQGVYNITTRQPSLAISLRDIMTKE